MTATLIIGGARSGKSRRALELAGKSGKQKVFVATAEALDEEMADRISNHQSERDSSWETREVPLDLAAAIAAASADEFLVVDCLTLWLSNAMHVERDVVAESKSLCSAVANSQCDVALVSNEVGLGLVPESPLGRAFRDEQGRLNQAMAGVCDRVEFVAAGLPMTLKS